jgi:hypothetical protein
MSTHRDHQRFDIELIRAGAVVAAFEVRTGPRRAGHRRRLWHIRLDQGPPRPTEPAPAPEPAPEPTPPAGPGRHRRPDE